MAVIVKLKHVEKTADGRLRYRRRFPKEVAAGVGKAVFNRALGADTDAALLRAWSIADAAFAAEVSAARKRLANDARKGPREVDADIRRRAAELVASISASPVLDDEGSELQSAEDVARSILAETLEASGADPALYRAVVRPNAPEAQPTLRDAVNLYLRERLGAGEELEEGKDIQRVERVFGRVADAIGPLDKMELSALRNRHGIEVRDHYLALRKQTGAHLALTSIKREMNIIKAVVNFAIRGFDLEASAKNPFEKMVYERRGKTAPSPEADKRKPLPAAVITGVSGRLRAADLSAMWRLLACTGCRLAEVSGLRVEDVDLTGEYPHIRVQWHEGRRLKTEVSIRSVPLVGDAIDAAKDALALPRSGSALFERYGRPEGSEAASAALRKHVRLLTKDPKHVVHSLRHNMRDWLELSEASEVATRLILGHALGGVGARVYGGDRLALTTAALRAALARATREGVRTVPTPTLADAEVVAVCLGYGVGYSSPAFARLFSHPRSGPSATRTASRQAPSRAPRSEDMTVLVAGTGLPSRSFARCFV